MLVSASSCPNYFILHITSILLVGTDGQYLAPCPATVGRAPDVFLLQTASWTRNTMEWRASITLGMEVPQAQVLIAINILTVLNRPTFLGYLPLYHVSGQSWLTDKATDTGSETSGVVQETRKIWFEAPSAGISTDMGELTDDPDSDFPDLQPQGELDKGLLMSPVSTTLLCGFCFHSQRQSRFYPLQAEFYLRGRNLLRFKYYQMIFLIKKQSVAFKLRIELDSLFRPFTSHQTKDSSEGSNATQFNCTLKWDIWSLQMNVKHVLFEQRSKTMTQNPFKGEFSILVLSHSLSLLKARPVSPGNAEWCSGKARLHHTVLGRGKKTAQHTCAFEWSW